MFYFTTCGWMMWNWLASALASEATLLLYDGSPFYPDGYAPCSNSPSSINASLFGTSAGNTPSIPRRIISSPKINMTAPMRQRMMTSTSSPLSPEGFDYVYAEIMPDVHLAIHLGRNGYCFLFPVLGNPLMPVHRGEIQGQGLGMDVDVFDTDGKPLKEKARANWFARRRFPSMPVGF